MRVSAYLTSRRASNPDATLGAAPSPAEPPHILRQHFALSMRHVDITPLGSTPVRSAAPGNPTLGSTPLRSTAPGNPTLGSTPVRSTAPGNPTLRSTAPPTSFPVWSVAPMKFEGVTAEGPSTTSESDHLDEVSPAKAADKAVLYVLPGGFVKPIQPRNWNFVSQLAEAGLRVDIPLYGLVPDYSAAHGLPLIRECYRQLVADHGADNVTVIADSAGGGLFLSALAWPFGDSMAGSNVAESPLPAPKAIVLNAPWLDMDLSNPDIEEFLPSDPLLNPQVLRPQGVLWASGLVTAGICSDAAATQHPAVSPLLMTSEKLCEALSSPRPAHTYIYCGTRDISLPDCGKLASRIKEVGAVATLHEEEGAIHMYHLTNTPEGRAARKRMIEIATT
ncbi:alpha/beta hydrolase fold protein [Corynebacterium auriscanis]|nr:alpha/beta hydrolase fold protein [Corynebacterium auriscanis]